MCVSWERIYQSLEQRGGKEDKSSGRTLFCTLIPPPSSHLSVCSLFSKFEILARIDIAKQRLVLAR